MDKILRIKDISTYRSELMGWSIVWILMLHFGFYSLRPLGFIAQYGYAGVDIFLFVSGFGLFYSLDKKPSLLYFYRKRLVRIFPAYYIVGAFASLGLFHDTILQYLFRYTTIGFWTGGLYYEWFVPSILLLYLLAPLFKQMGVKGQAVLAGCFLIISYCILGREDLIDGVHFFLFYRVPAFLFGMICAQWLKNGVHAKWFLWIALAGIPFFLWLYPKFHQVYLYKYYSVFFLMPIFIIVFIGLSKYVKCTNIVMRYIGRSSLEIYLIQNIFFCQVTNGVIPRSDLNTFLWMTVSVVSGILLHEGIERTLSKLK